MLTRCNRSIVVVSMKVWVDHMVEDHGYADDASIFLLWIFIWVGVNYCIAYFYRIKDGNDEVARKIFDSVVIASAAGAIGGFCLTFLLILILGFLGLIGVPIDWLFDLVGIGGLIIFFFAAVNVTGIIQLLKDGSHVIIRTDTMEISHRHDDDPPPQSSSWLELLKKSSKGKD